MGHLKIVWILRTGCPKTSNRFLLNHFFPYTWRLKTGGLKNCDHFLISKSSLGLTGIETNLQLSPGVSTGDQRSPTFDFPPNINKK